MFIKYFITEELSASQKQAIVTLTEKKSGSNTYVAHSF